MTIENLEQLLQQAKQGDVQAQNNLGLLYLNDDNLAFEAYRFSSKNGKPRKDN